jgi:hypothetical protein
LEHLVCTDASGIGNQAGCGDRILEKFLELKGRIMQKGRKL